MLEIAIPFLVNQMIKYTSSKEKQLHEGLLLLGAIFFTKVFGAIAQTNFVYNSTILRIRIRSGIIIALLEKSFKFSFSLCPQYNVCNLTNLFDRDVEKISLLFENLFEAIFLPIQILIGIILMYSYVGLSFLPGLFIIIIITYIYIKLTNIQKE